MIKNLLTAAAIALLTAGSAFAEGVSIGETNYASLKDAVDNVADGQTITISGTQNVGGRITFNGSKTVTVKGTDNATVKMTNVKEALILLGGANVTFEDITFDADNLALEKDKPVEINNTAGNAATFKNCKFVNFKQSRVIFSQKPLTLENVTAENCEVTTAVVFISNNNDLIVGGNSNYSVYIDGNRSFTAESNVAGKITISYSAYNAGATVVKGSENLEVFSLAASAPEGYTLVAQDGNLVLSFEKMVVTNETQNTQYSSLLAALDAAKSDDVLIVNEDIEMGGRFIIKSKNLTVKGANANVVIKRTDTNKNNLMFETDNSTLTIEDIVIDCNNVDINKNVFNNKKALVLKNVVIKNAVGSAALIGGGTATLENVTGENNAENLMVSVNSLSLNGNNNLPVNLASGATITVPEGGVLTNEQPIELTLATVPELGTAIVSGTTDYKKFTVTNEGFYLNPDKDNNNLVLSDHKTTGIEDVVVDENAPVEYYNLSGMRVNGDNMAPGVYIKRQGAKATKVYVK